MAKNRKNAKISTEAANTKPLVDISEDDQWRIIQESGILNKIPANPDVAQGSANENKDEEGTEEPLFSPLAEEIFSAITLIIPHCSLLLMMETLIHYQYGRRPTWEALFNRMLSGVPILSIFIFYTSRYKYTRMMQSALFFLAIGCGTRMIWLVNYANWKDNMKLCPPLATVWVYAIVQLNLLPAVISLLIVATWIQYKKLKLFF